MPRADSPDFANWIISLEPQSPLHEDKVMWMGAGGSRKEKLREEEARRCTERGFKESSLKF